MRPSPAESNSVTVGQPINLTDVGNAARFARDHAGHVRYCSTLGWLIWSGTHWRIDDIGEVERLARDTVRAIYQEAAETANGTERTRVAKWAMESESRAGIRAMLDLARSELGIACTAAVFDRNGWLLNTASGIIDLKTGECREHEPSALITKLAPSFYHAVPCPRWLTFLDRIMHGDLEMIEFLQRAVGYSLTGDTSEQGLFLLHGPGSNGKSTFLETLRAILGDYAKHTPAETLIVKSNGSGIPNDLARLRGARFVTAVETEDGRRLAEGLVKQMTGSDTITARFLHREFFEFRPEFKLWLATNHKPTIRGTDHAIWRRIRLIPFTVTIPSGERDKDLGRRLLEESTGILAWAVEGCKHWQRLGLAEPDAVRVATGQYREEMDPLTDFLGDRCAIGDGFETAFSVLYGTYTEWAKNNGRHPMSSKTFSIRLEGRGFHKGRRGDQRFFLGIAARGTASGSLTDDRS